MGTVPYELLAFILTPLLSALGTLFWLVIREKDRRLEDKENQMKRLQDSVDNYRDATLPALDSIQQSLKQLADLIEGIERNTISSGRRYGR